MLEKFTLDVMTSYHTHSELRNSLIHPILKFDLNDNLPHVSPIISLHHVLGYDPARLYVRVNLE